MALKLDSRFRGNDKITVLANFLIVAGIATLIFLPASTSAGILPACAATGACQTCDIVNVFVTLGKWLITGAGGLALLVIVWAAFGMVTSAGNAEKVGAAKKQITGAIFGLGITLVAFQLVSMLIAILTVPSSNQSFSAQTSQETGKFASLANFLGIPWWEICSVKGLRTAQAKYEKDINYRGTNVCRYWGDGTPCQTLSDADEQKLVDCQALEGLSDLTDEEKRTQEEKCKDIKVLRCCSGTCTDKECITKKITQPIAESSTAYKEQASMLAAPGVKGNLRTCSNKSFSPAQCGASTMEDEIRVRKALGDVAVQRPIDQTCGYQTRYCDAPGGGCTQVGGLDQNTISSLIALNKFCKQQFGKNCVVITGGTECGHATHGPPNIVDLDDAPKCTSTDRGEPPKCAIGSPLLYSALVSKLYYEQRGAPAPGTYQCEISGVYTACFQGNGSFTGGIDHFHVNVK